MGKEIISILIIRKRKKYEKGKVVLERERSIRKRKKYKKRKKYEKEKKYEKVNVAI